MLILALLLASAASIAGWDGAKSATFSNAQCKARFLVPSGWMVVPSDAQEPCTFLVRPRNFNELVKEADNVDFFTIRIEVVTGDLRAAAEKLQYFVYRDGKWAIDSGLSGTTDAATPISGHGWRGYKGETSTRCYHNGGGYSGLCDIHVAVISNSTLASAFDGATQTEEQFGQVLRSFRFLN